MIEVEIEDPTWLRDLPDAQTVAVEAAHRAMPTPSGGEGAPMVDEIDILLTSDEAVRALNARFRGKDAPTNVLSFPALQTAQGHLGDIALAYGVCAREATAQGKPLADHLSHLVVHGVLHLLGYDHEVDAQAQAMEDRERAILAELGIADPYRLDGALA